MYHISSYLSQNLSRQRHIVANENFLGQELFIQYFYVICFTNVFEIYSKFFQNIAAYTNFNLGIWVLGFTILCDSSEFQLFVVSGYLR